MKAQPSQGNPHSPLPGVRWVKLALIDTEDQVRTSMDQAALAELAEDVKAHGLLQPLILRPTRNGRFCVIAGHRRRFACEMAGLKQVPAIVGEADANQVLELQMAENLQREDLSLEDTARMVQKLYEQHASLDTVALVLNKSKPWVSKHLKLANDLHHAARKLFEDGVSEDLELLLTLSDIYWRSNDQGDKAVQLIVENNKQPFARPIRAILRDQLTTLKASQATAQRVDTNSRKPAKPKARNADQLARDLEYSVKKPSDMMAAWSTQDLTTFHSGMQEHYRAGQQMKRDPVALVTTRTARRNPFALAFWHGFLNPSEQMPFGDADYQAMLDRYWEAEEAR